MDEDLSTDARPLAPRLRIKRLLRDIADGSAWEPTPWRAVQRAAWAAVKQIGAAL
jgi:hypothetical protein